MLGESAESGFEGTEGSGFCWVTSHSISDWKPSTNAGWFSNLDSRRLSALESRITVVALSGLKFSSVTVIVDAECTGSMSGDLDNPLPSVSESTGLSSFSMLRASKVDVETCCETWMAVDWSSGCSIGDFELMRWKIFVDLFGKTRTGLRTTPRALELSGISGEPERVEELLPMSTGVFGRRFDRNRGTCVIAVQLFVSLSDLIRCRSSGIATVVNPFVLSKSKSEGRWSRAMRVERGGLACVDSGTVATSCIGVSWKVM